MLSFYMDEDSMQHALIRGLTSGGVDVQTAAGAGMLALPDEEQLVYAASVGRVIYTGNVDDFARLHGEWLNAGRHHAGIVVRSKQQLPAGVQLRALLRLAVKLDPEAMRDRMEFLGTWME